MSIIERAPAAQLQNSFNPDDELKFLALAITHREGKTVTSHVKEATEVFYLFKDYFLRLKNNFESLDGFRDFNDRPGVFDLATTALELDIEQVLIP